MLITYANNILTLSYVLLKGRINDPTKRVVTKYNEEKKMIDTTQADELKSGGRETLSVLMWGSGKIEATPHGHFAKAYQHSVEAKSIKEDYHNGE